MAIPTLTLGSFNLTDWAGTQYATSIIAEGTSKGAPVPIEVAVKSWLQDGSIVVTQGYDNRTVNLRVKLRGTSLTAVANAEAALNLELGKTNTLTWTPASGPASVFVVVTSSMEPSPSTDEDIAEGLATPWRTYNLRLLCEAFVRSTTEVTTAALAGSGTTTTNVDTMGAATGWSATSNGVGVSVVNAAGPPTTNSATQPSAAGAYTIAMTKTISTSTSSLKYLIVDWTGTVSGADYFISDDLDAFGDGVALSRLATNISPTAGYTRTWFGPIAASSITSLRLEWASDVPRPGATGSRVLSLDNIAVSDVKPGTGTARQQIRTIAVSGSARTQGSLTVESATAALGDTLVYVYPSDPTTTSYVPAMRQFRTSGNTVTADSTLLSGSRESTTGSGITYTIPNARLPQGNYLLIARLQWIGGTTTPVMNYTAQAVLNATNIGPAVTGSAQITVTSTYQNFTLGRLVLPTLDLPPSSAASITLNLRTTGLPDCDEVWLFNTTIGQLVQVQCGTGAGAVGGAARRLFIRPADILTPRPTVRIGHSADGSDSFAPSALQSWMPPQFNPPEVNVFTATSNATDSGASLRHYPRWHTHAAS